MTNPSWLGDFKIIQQPFFDESDEPSEMYHLHDHDAPTIRRPDKYPTTTPPILDVHNDHHVHEHHIQFPASNSNVFFDRQKK